ncbi:TPA: hypothetical protein ACLGYO_003046 [Acinetobacter baumannii]|nr:hypothetical protein [Acinetobacter baumannii]EKW1698646.1 hypothetical protein [Acinetobacter baumannii]ELA6732424.1 hypothetical protein [Acinetobacter baumannii]EMB9939640.1 hypothetical protein [Acinetobacter baumannii]
MIHENIYMHDVIDIFDVYQKDDLLKKSKLGLMKKWDTFSIIAIFLSIIALIGGSLWLVGLVSHEKSNNVDTAFMIAISGLVSIIINYYLNKKITEIILRKVFYSSKEKEFKLSRPMYINLVLLSDYERCSALIEKEINEDMYKKVLYLKDNYNLPLKKPIEKIMKERGYISYFDYEFLFIEHFYKRFLCTRQISQNPYPIRVLPS